MLLLPVAAYAQAAITGVVKDTSGAVLPGVTVEAASPAMIEKVRTVVTDGTGQFRVVDLRPGTYSVAFTLPGFSTVKREGIELSGTFVATVNADMRVGALEETITITGESPVVDVQSTKVQQTISKDVIAMIPTSRTSAGIQSVIPGVSGFGLPDVGNPAGGGSGGAATIHGGSASDSRMLQDGLTTQYNNGASGNGNTDTAGAQEIVVTTSAGLAEAETSGLSINVIPREGGNKFASTMYYNWGNGAMQGSNYTQRLKDQGLRSPQEIVNGYAINPGGGGRIVRDKLWFYSAVNLWGATNTVPNIFRNMNAGNPDAWTVNFDRTQPARNSNFISTVAGRLTWQVTPRNKVAAYWSEQYQCAQSPCLIGGGTGGGTPSLGVVYGAATGTAEASGKRRWGNPGHVQQVTWTSPITTRLLFEAGFGTYAQRYSNMEPRPDGLDSPAMIQVVEQGGALPGLAYRAPIRYDNSTTGTNTWRASLTNVTGAHAMKVGYYGGFFNPTFTFSSPRADGIVQYRFLNGVPNQITLVASNPLHLARHLLPTSLWGQDQWTRGRLTLQGGLRYDYFLTRYPEQRFGGTAAVPNPIVFPAGSQRGLHFHDLSPRMAAAYDLFGNGMTAIKATLGRYVGSISAQATGTGTQSNAELDLNPINRMSGGTPLPLVDATTRSWNDANRNYIPECDISNVAANGECGAMANQNFGREVFALNFDPALTEGWFKRPYNWEFSATVQQQLLPRVAVTGSYFRKWFRNFSEADNRAVTPEDFDVYSVPVPTDPRLPGGGGGTISGLYDVKPAKFGQLDSIRVPAANFGNRVEYWHGVDINMTARLFGDALTVQGGTSTGRSINDRCDVLPDNPSPLYCRVVTPFQTSFRGFAAYTIPWVDLLVSGTWRADPGPQLAAFYNVSNAVVSQRLGRNLAGGAANVRVNLVTPGTLYGDTIKTVDFRIAKMLRFGKARTQIGLDLYNALNTDVVTSYNQTFVPGGAWLGPLAVLPARFAKLTAQFDF